jgi:predicted aspartyl protease
MCTDHISAGPSLQGQDYVLLTDVSNIKLDNAKTKTSQVIRTGDVTDNSYTQISAVREIITHIKPSGSSISIPVEINSLKISAVVDTAAQVTVINKNLLKQMKPNPVLGNLIKLTNAEKGKSINSRMIQVRLVIGKNTFKVAAFAAPISDAMLLGLDFLKVQKAIVNLKENTLKLGDHEIPAVSPSI